MREIHLPSDATEGDLQLAERIAVAFDSGDLHVLWSGGVVSAGRGPATARAALPAPAEPEREPTGLPLLATLMAELASGLLALLESFVTPPSEPAGGAR